MRNMKRWLAALLAVVMVLPSLLVPGFAAGSGFEDVPENSWYASAVEYVNEKGYMTGVGNDKFAPDAEVTRAMFVTVLSRLAMVQTDGLTSDFADVAAGRWYTGAIAWAAENGIVNGVGNGRFAPTKAISRQDLCTILYRFVNTMGYQLTAAQDVSFTDASSVSAYAADAVRFAASVGLVAGYSDGSFHPTDTATRAQTAVIVMRLAQLLDGQIVKPEPMPAQSFAKEAGNGMAVTVEAPEGALPENTDMTVSRVTDEAALAAIKDKVGAEIYAAADITFTKDGAELEPDKAVQVEIALDSLKDIKNPAVVHIRDDGSAEYVASELVSLNRSGSAKALRFSASDFSVYAVINDPSGNNAFTVTVNFYVRKNQASGPSSTDSNWELINKQIIRSNQIDAAKDNDDILIFDPGVPELKSTQAFEGWARTKNFTDSDDKLSVADMNAKIKADYKDGTLHEAVERSYYAEVYDVVYVEFHDQAGAVLRTDYHHVAEGQNYANAMINMTYAPFKDNQNFTGWVTRKDVLTLGDYPTYAANPDPVIRNNTEYQVSETLELYPYLQDGYWLIFDPNIANNDSDPTKCEYKGPDFVPKGTLTSEPTFKNEHPRPGYELEGWYTDPTLRNRYTFGQALTKDTTLYAKWTPIEAKYLVVFVVQNADDPTKYDYYDSVSRNWRYDSGKVNTKSGDMVSAYTAGSTMNDSRLASVDLTGATYYSADKTIAKLGQYYKYSTKNNGNSVLVRGDGSTVLRVYYDRKTVTMRYWAGTYSSSASDVYYSYSTYGTSLLDTAKHYFLYNTSTGEYVHCVASGTAYAYDSSGRVIYTSGAILTDDDGHTYYFSNYTVYVYVQGTTSNTKIAEFTGLYGAQLTDEQRAQVNVDYPYEYCFQSTTSGSYVLYGVPYVFTNPGDPYGGNPYTFDYYLTTRARSLKEKTINRISQDPESETGVWMMDDPIGTSTCTNSINTIGADTVGRTFIGYNLARNSMSTSQGYVSLGESGGQTYTFKVDDITGEAAYAYFKLNHYQLAFQSNGNVVKERTLPYGRKLARYAHVDDNADNALFVPDNGPEGYFFDGWYTDESYQKPFKFNGTMPAHSVTLYAKWTMIRYRVFLDYAGGESEAQITFPDGTYSSTWRLDFGEQVDENRIANVTRDGWVLLGWYLDPEFKHAFNFSMGANDSMVYGDEAYYYGIQMPGESDEAYAARMNGSTRRGTDSLSGSAWDDTWDTDWETHDYSGEYEAAGYESADEMRTARGERHNVVHTIRLYAKWRQDPEGTVGIRVNYLGDNLPSTGYFNVNDRPHEWLDPETYADRADAYAQAASVPEVPGEQFLYWEILDEHGDPTGRRVYPGQTWQVRLEEAQRIRKPVPNPNCEHGSVSFVEAKAANCTENGNEAHWICNLCGKCFSDEAHTTEINPTIPATGHTWGEWQYQQNGQGGHYHICSVCQTRAGGAHVMEQTAYTAPTTTSEGSKTETCSVCGYSKTTVLPMLEGYTVSFSVPAGVTQPADQTGLEDGASVTLPTTLTGVPAGYTFLGWVEQSVAETTDVVTPLTSYTVSGDATLYALFTCIKDSDTVTYELVTSSPDDWAGNYVITYGTDSSLYAMKGVSGSASGTDIEDTSSATAYASTGMTLDGSILSNVSDAYVFTMEASGSYFTVKSVSTGAYIGQLNDTNRTLAAYSTLNTTYCRWTPGYYTDNASSMYNANGTRYPLLSFNTSYYYFWSGSTSNQAANAQNVRFWKEISTATYYTTVISGGETPDPAEGYTVTYYADGSQAYEDYVGQYEAGEEYNVTSPTITGFTPNEPLVSGNMPSGDHSRTVTYSANTVSNERWEPTQTIVPGEDYLIAYVLNGTPYLLVNYNVNATDHYGLAYTYTSNGSNKTGYMGYLAPAAVATEDGTEYVVGVNGAASDLQYCHWIFSDANGGTITSGYESERSLLWAGSTAGPAGVYPASSGDTWKWKPNTNDNMGSMTNTWVSTNTYVMYFYPCTDSGTFDTTTNAPYAGVSQDAFTNVRLYKKVVEEGETTWTVNFVDEDGVSMADEGYPSYETTDGSAVTRPADPQREDYYFLGWFYKNSEGQEVQYNFGDAVHGDLTLIAHFLYAWEDEYIVTLRAVYGMKNTTGTTHIYWYANDGTDAGHGVGAGDRFEQIEIDMNVAYGIPYPTSADTPTTTGALTWTGGTWQPNQTQINPTGLTFEGRTFLGWARLDTVGSGTTGTAHPELTEDDLYLKWDAENKKFLYREESRDGTVSWTNAKEVTDVYADETKPFHDMYAVWSKPTVYYVYHSATGKLEAIDLNAVKGGATGTGTDNLQARVTEGYLYGGYYSDFGGLTHFTETVHGEEVTKTIADMIAESYGNNVARFSFDETSAQSWAAATTAEATKHVIATFDLSTNAAKTGYEEYTGAVWNSNNLPFWAKAKAYNTANATQDNPVYAGTELVPTAGTVYYLKEVPADYLPARMIAVRNTGVNDGVYEHDGEISALYLLTAVDDVTYRSYGFLKGETSNLTGTPQKSTISKKFKVYYKDQNGDVVLKDTYTAHKLSEGIGENDGYVVSYQVPVEKGKSAFILPTWITLDGVTVSQNQIQYYVSPDGKTVSWPYNNNP